jgi:hypothetical protein
VLPSQPQPVRAWPQQPQSQVYAPQPQPQPAKWQATAPTPTKVRGVSADAIAKFVMPSPESLGVSTNLNLTATPAPAKQADWNQIQARMEQLKVLRYEKDRPQAGVVRVKMLLPTSDPTRGQPVEAQAETEAAAVLMALDAAENWQRMK